MVGTGIGARRWGSGALAALAALALVAPAGCTPGPETATVVNETGLTLVPDGVRVEGDPIPGPDLPRSLGDHDGGPDALRERSRLGAAPSGRLSLPQGR